MDRWIADSIIYQVNWRAMAAREPANPFTAAAEDALDQTPMAYVTDNLSVLCKLGVNLLYLMPPFPIGIEGRKGIGSPYAIRDYRGVSSEYGTVAELRALIARAHTMGMRVIIDLTPNHTSRDNVWVDAHPEYYVHNEDGSLFFDFDWSDTAKLDYHGPGTRQAMTEVLAYWLQPDVGGGVDGFRLDMAHMVNDLSFWDEAIPKLKALRPEQEILFLGESYGFETNLDLMRRGFSATYDDDLYKICQHGYAVTPEGQSIVRLSEAGGHDSFRHLYDAFRGGGIAGAVSRVLDDYHTRLAGLPGPAWLARYTDNHDEGRGLHRFGPGAVRAMMQLVFLAPHTIPFLLGGQEFGAVNRPSIHARMGTCDKGPRVLDEQGGETEQAGIEFVGNLFAGSVDERRAWCSFYRSLIALRKANVALTRGDLRWLDVGEDCPTNERSVVAFERRCDAQTVRCAVNLGAQPRRLTAPDALAGSPLYGKLSADVLGAFEAVVL